MVSTLLLKQRQVVLDYGLPVYIHPQLYRDFERSSVTPVLEESSLKSDASVHSEFEAILC